MKVAFREEGVHWLSQGKSDENKMMRNSLQLLALLGLFWQAQRTVRSQPIYEVCKSLKKKKKEKKKCSIFLMSAPGGSWAAAECQRLGRAQPLSFAFLPRPWAGGPLELSLASPRHLCGPSEVRVPGQATGLLSPSLPLFFYPSSALSPDSL